MAIRFDRLEVKLNQKKPFKTPDGVLLLDAVFAKDGVMEYRDSTSGKIRRELRPPEENKKAIAEFGLLPYTARHPSELVTEDNAGLYRKGISLASPKYEFIPGKGGFVTGQIAVLDSATQSRVMSGELSEISPGYKCRLEEKAGVWIAPDGSKHRYDAIQRDLELNHIAGVEMARGGVDVRVRIDSADFDDPDIAYQEERLDSSSLFAPRKETRMATLRIDSAEYEAPEILAVAIAPKLKRLDELEDERDQLIERSDEMETELVRVQARADAAEFCLGNAEEILTSLGFKRDSEGEYYKVDMGKKTTKKAQEEDDEELEGLEGEDDDEEAEGEEEMPKAPFKKSKDKTKKMTAKKDSADPKTSLKQMLLAWQEADEMIGRNDEDDEAFSKVHLDEADTITDIHKLVIAELTPEFKLDGKTPQQIESAYEMLRATYLDSGDEDEEDDEDEYEDDEDDEEEEERAPSRRRDSKSRKDSYYGSYTEGLRNAVNMGRKFSSERNSSPLPKAQENRQKTTAEAWQEPLAMSR